MSIASRIGRIEQAIGTDAEPRRVIVWHSPGYEESWIERNRGWDGRDLSFHVKTPDRDASPMEHLTPEMRALIRPNDRVVLFEHLVPQERNPHLQAHRPPWKRRPWRLDPDCKSYRLQDEDGEWGRREFR